MFRYVDICLGVSFLMSHSLLAYSGVRELRLLLKLFFLLTASTLTTYWVWFAYLKYGMEEHEASKELSDTRWAGTVLLYSLLYEPVQPGDHPAVPATASPRPPPLPDHGRRQSGQQV